MKIKIKKRRLIAPSCEVIWLPGSPTHSAKRDKSKRYLSVKAYPKGIFKDDKWNLSSFLVTYNDKNSIFSKNIKQKSEKSQLERLFKI